MNLGKIYCNKSDNWSSPKNIIDSFLNNGYIDFNPLNVFYSNSLLKDYNNYYCNPPFSNIEPFVDFMIDNHKNGFNSVLLLPVRVNTVWFQKLLLYGCDIVIVGRISYSNKGFAPFDSMIVYLTGSCNKIAWSRKFLEKPKKYIQLSIFDIGD